MGMESPLDSAGLKILEGERDKISPLLNNHVGQSGRSPGEHGSSSYHLDKMNLHIQENLS